MLVGRSGLSPVMVGRGAELDRLARLAGAGGGPTVALVGGEPGIGKTRLVQELVARIPADVIVLAGQADPGTLSRPFELLLDAVDGVGGARCDRAGRCHEHLLAAIIDASIPLDERVRTAHELIRHLIEGRSAVVLFDDLHWADSESVSLFERLAEPDGGPLLLVGTYRPDAITRRHPMAELLPRLERRHTVVHLRLERLNATDVSAFLGAVYGVPPSFRVVEALHTRTGGNPFFLEELLAAAGEVDPEELCSQPLPWNLAELVGRQLDDLDPHERRIVEAAAVLGRKVPFDLLATVTRATEDELIAVLRDLVHRGLMVEIENDVFAFRHTLAREAVEAELLGRERRRLHEAALEAMRESMSNDLVEMARHARGAGRYDDMVAAAREGGARYLSVGSSYQALQLAELGLSEVDDDLELLSIAARAAWLAGLVPDATEHAQRWIEAARKVDDIEATSAAMRLVVRLNWEAGDVSGMDAAAFKVREVIEQLPEGEERARALTVVAQSYMLQEQPVEAIEWAEQGLAMAQALDLPDVCLAALVEKGSAMQSIPGREDEGVALLLQVAEEGERLGEWVIVARAVHNAVRARRRPPPPGEARELLDRMRVAAERAGFDSLAGASFAQGLAGVCEWEGDLQGARDALADGRQRDRGYLFGGKGSWYSVHEAGLALEAGDIDRAEQIRRELEPLVGGTKVVWYWGLAAHVACRRGDLTDARLCIGKLIEAMDESHNGDANLVHDVLAAGLSAGLAPDELRPVVERARSTEKHALSADVPTWSLLQAQLLEAEHRTQEALAEYQAAIAPSDIPLLPDMTGFTHVGAARCLIALGRLDEARAEVAVADRLLARWGGWRVAQLQAVQRRLGLGAPVAGPDSLTPREREVVALVAEGLTNAELAERLFISPKTAAVHVSNILAKLGMASRTEVAAWAVRENLAKVI